MTKPYTHLVFSYSEQVVQFGTLIFFSGSFTLAPFFTLLTNMLEIKVKMRQMVRYNRRRVALGASGIGNWVFVMEIFAIICVPMNIAILYFTGEVFSGKTADGKNFYKVNNYWAKFLLSNDPVFWTPVAIILLAVAVEHGILVVKILIATFIPDVPAGVEERESKREKIKEQAELDIQDFKHRNNAQSFEDIKREYAREQAMLEQSKWLVKNL